MKKQITKAEFEAMADELIPIETLDKEISIYIKKDDNKISFYKSCDYDLEYNMNISYYYLFSVSVNSLSIGSINTFQIYKEVKDATSKSQKEGN